MIVTFASFVKLCLSVAVVLGMKQFDRSGLYPSVEVFKVSGCIWMRFQGKVFTKVPWETSTSQYLLISDPCCCGYFSHTHSSSLSAARVAGLTLCSCTYVKLLPSAANMPMLTPVSRHICALDLFIWFKAQHHLQSPETTFLIIEELSVFFYRACQKTHIGVLVIGVISVASAS
jgi:hypothetical protein